MKRFNENEIKTIKAIFSQANPTRTSIAHTTGLSLVKISSMLADLEKRQYIEKVGKTKTTGGRPAFVYQLKPTIGLSIGVCLAGDSFHLVGIDGTSVVINEIHPLALLGDSDGILESIIENVASVLKNKIENAPQGQSVVSIGLALPGMVDTLEGVWLLGLQLTGITQIDIARRLEQQLGVPVFIEDVSRAVTFLEKHRNLASGLDNFVLMYIGLGLGAGIVINGQLYRGHHGLAGEIGHIEHAENTYRCSCTRVGCLETVVSTGGILRVFRDRLKEGVRSTLQKIGTGSEKELTLQDILHAAQEGDRLAQTTLDEIGVFLGDGCATMTKLFNPRLLIVSGPGSIFRDYFRDPVQRVIQQRVFPEMLVDFETVFAEYENYHEAWGAALLAMSCYFENGCGD
jgi:predicted NBD/HSP70 family sugar kinase